MTFKDFDTGRDIILYGANDCAADFCERWGNRLKICSAATESTKAVVSQPLAEWGIDTVFFDDIERSGKEMVIICDEYLIYSRKLKTLGLTEYRDFVYVALANVFLEQKKLAVFMGTALTGQVKALLDKCAGFSNEFGSVFYHENSMLTRHSNKIAEYKHIARCCDLYIYSICEKNKYPLKVMRKSALPPSCKMISISDYCFWGYYPQLEQNRDYISDFFLRERDRLNILYYTLAFARADKNLESMCMEGVEPEVIVKRVCSGDYYSASDIAQNFSQAIENTREADAHADIKMAEYLINATDGIPANRNLDEWNPGALAYIVSEVFLRLGYGGKPPELQFIKSVTDGISGSEIPVYPSVAAHLGLFNIHESTKYKIVSYYKTIWMTFEEYTNYYVEYLLKAKELIDHIGWRRKIFDEKFASV